MEQPNPHSIDRITLTTLQPVSSASILDSNNILQKDNLNDPTKPDVSENMYNKNIGATAGDDTNMYIEAKTRPLEGDLNDPLPTPTAKKITDSGDV